MNIVVKRKINATTLGFLQCEQKDLPKSILTSKFGTSKQYGTKHLPTELANCSMKYSKT